MLNSEWTNWSEWGGGFFAFIFPISHRSPHILYWGKSSYFLAFELPNSQGCGCLKGSQLPFTLWMIESAWWVPAVASCNIWCRCWRLVLSSCGSWLAHSFLHDALAYPARATAVHGGRMSPHPHCQVWLRMLCTQALKAIFLPLTMARAKSWTQCLLLFEGPPH